MLCNIGVCLYLFEVLRRVPSSPAMTSILIKTLFWWQITLSQVFQRGIFKHLLCKVVHVLCHT